MRKRIERKNWWTSNPYPHPHLLRDPSSDQAAVANFIYKLEKGDFLTWEAVVCHEQGMPLTAQQEDALDGLINFGDPEDEQVLYIDEIPRPSEP